MDPDYAHWHTFPGITAGHGQMPSLGPGRLYKVACSLLGISPAGPRTLHL